MKWTIYQFENESEYFLRLFLEDSLPQFVNQTTGQVEDVGSDVVNAATRNYWKSRLENSNFGQANFFMLPSFWDGSQFYHLHVTAYDF